MKVLVSEPQEREVTIKITETAAVILAQVLPYVEGNDELFSLANALQGAGLKDGPRIAVKREGGFRAYDPVTEW